MGLAALLMSGAMQSGEPATLTLGADAISQPNGGAPVVLAQRTDTTSKKKRVRRAARRAWIRLKRGNEASRRTRHS
jgi:hypothetical protein